MTATVGSPPGRVVVRLPNWIGDIVMATPLLRALRQAWPRAHVAVAGPKHAAAILDGLDSVDEVLDLPSRRASGLGGMRRAAARLAEGRFDLGLLLTNSFSSALVMALARVPLRVGYAEGGRGPLLTHKVSRRSEAGRHRMPVPMVEAYARLLDAVGVPRAGHRYELVATPDDEQAADAWMQRQGLPPDAPLWGFHPGASFGPSKLWYPERFAAVDANKDGAVTEAEVKAHAEARRAEGEKKMAEARTRMFESMDADKNGQISRTEWDSHHAGMKMKWMEHRETAAAGGNERREMRMKFKDGEGRKGHHMMHRGGMGWGGFGEKGFETADANNDGRVTLAEAKAKAFARFDAADTNKDGTLSPDERRAAHEAKRAERRAERGDS